MGKKSFFNNDKAILTVMVQASNPERIKELMDKSAPEGAEAFGIQLEQLESEYKNKKIYKELFQYAKDKPIYVTNYRFGKNEGKTDEQLADEMLEVAELGAELCDIMGDCFDKQPDELAVDETAINKQTELISKIHSRGSKVLMSSHVMKYTPAERVLEIALEHKRRGADISKIVTGADTMEEQLENLKTVNYLKEKLGIPFLFLASGECKILRRLSGELGSCMYLCVYEHDSLSTPQQPTLNDIKVIRNLFNK